MDTNVGEMPIDIFSDYVSDTLGQEWSWEYIIPILNGISQLNDYGDGLDMNEETLGNGDYYEYVTIFFGNAKGNGGQDGNHLYGFAHGGGDSVQTGNGHNGEEYEIDP
jgi:hypothetical protein